MANKLFKALPKLKNPNAATKPFKLKNLGKAKAPKINFPKLSGAKGKTKGGTKNDLLKKIVGKYKVKK